MKQRNVILFTLTYIVIFLVVILGGYILYSPISKTKLENEKIGSDIQVLNEKINKLDVNDEVKNIYNNYNNEVKSTYEIVNKSLSNMLLLVLISLSLSFIILGFILFFNLRKNKGMYIGLIASGFTIILFTIWFIYQSINVISMI